MALRDIIFWFVPKSTRASMEAESRKWIATCPNCGARTSVWDLGGVRWKAAGKPLQGMACRSCGTFGMHQIAYEEKAA